MLNTQTNEIVQLFLGRCTWCGGLKNAFSTSGKAVAHHPPEDCCPTRILWGLSWRIDALAKLPESPRRNSWEYEEKADLTSEIIILREKLLVMNLDAKTLSAMRQDIKKQQPNIDYYVGNAIAKLGRGQHGA